MTSSLYSRSSANEDWGLDQWLQHLLALHPKDIDMGLSRVQAVLDRLGPDLSRSQVITVAGTNGKGTTCAFLEQAALQTQRSVGVYSSPHLQDYRERVRVNGKMLSEQAHCQAFLQVEQARGDIALTFFEFGTLAAILLLAQQQLDVLLLEIGLGGRLDAVNVVEPDLAVITTIGLDHMDWLGDTRELIGREKAGVMRTGKPVVVGELDVPHTLSDHAADIGAKPCYQGVEFGYQHQGDHWQYSGMKRSIADLPVPAIPLQNACTAMAVIESLRWHISDEQIRRVCEQTQLPGRFQQVAEHPGVYLDVAHNPQAVGLLAERIQQQRYDRLFLVCAMLADKDIAESIAPLTSLPATWLPASLNVPRGAKYDRVSQALVGHHVHNHYDSVVQAFQQAQALAAERDLIVVFGSFFTVAEILDYLRDIKG